ncbi:hypothetical protein IT568_13060 [bacterium]|nr:hypothetical protein [bacterium]
MFKHLYEIWKSDTLIQQAWQESIEMLEIDYEMIQASIETLRQKDTSEIAEEIRQKDKIINRYQRDVRQKVLTHIAASGIADLTTGLILTSIVISLERIGDYTKNIVDLAVHHPKRLSGGRFEEKLQTLEKELLENVQRGIKAFKTQDQDEARKIMTVESQQVADIVDEIVYSLVSGKTEGFDTAEAVTLALYVRYMKRINSQVRNIMSSIVNSFDRIGHKYKD